MTKILIMVAVLFATGCSTKKEVHVETIVKIQKTKIQIPDVLLLESVVPDIPKILNEKSISKYILELFIVSKLNESAIVQIREIVNSYNLDANKTSDLNISN